MLIVLSGLAMLSVGPQMARAQGTLESELNTRLSKAAAPSSNLVKPNEIVKGNIVYSGILVEALKTDNPLQLANPFAPARYGSAEDNTIYDPGMAMVYDPKVGISRAWKLFAIRF